MKIHKCHCGHLMDISKYLLTAEEAAYSDGEDFCLEEEFKCEICNSEYTIEVESTITVSTELISIECIYETTPELSGVELHGLVVGDSISAPDGMYQVGSNQYLIENGTLVSIFSALIDENQLQLEF